LVNDAYFGFELVLWSTARTSSPFTSLFSDTAPRNVTRQVMLLIRGSLELLLDPGTASTSSGFAWDDLTLYGPQEDRGVNLELKKNTIDPSGFQQLNTRSCVNKSTVQRLSLMALSGKTNFDDFSRKHSETW
jgi:hypothetical protein